MKIRYFVCCICVLFLAACTQEAHSPEKDPKQIQYENDLCLIRQLGYDVSDIRTIEDGYVVEGDILLTYEYLEDFGSLEQTRHTCYERKVAPEYQTVYITVSAANFQRAMSDAMDYWNENSECNIVFDQSKATCWFDVNERVVYKDFEAGIVDKSTLLLVEPPTILNSPGEITINMGCNNLPSGSEQEMYMMLHAFGHSFGFGHTPSKEGESVDGTYINGTAKYDPASIMVKESNPVHWSGFSENDIVAFKTLYPKSEPEPKPDFSTAAWKAGNDLAIRFKGNDIDDASRIHFPTYVELTGAGWSRYKNAEKFVRILDSQGKVVEKGNSANRYTLPAGSYTLQYGACVVNASGTSTCYYGQASFRVWYSEPSLWTSVLDEANVDLAHTYVIRTQYETYLPGWQNYTSTLTMTQAATGEEVELRYSSTADRWYFEFPARGTYEIVWTLTNGAGETKMVDKTLHITSPDAAPVYYKLYEEFVGPDRNREALSSFYLKFYSDSNCTQQITPTDATIEVGYILWDHYYDRHFQLASSSKKYEGTLLVPVGSSKFYLPHTISNATYYTLDQHVLEYEITFLAYK